MSYKKPVDYGDVLTKSCLYFVYGTLQSSYGNNSVFGLSSIYLGDDRTKEGYLLADCGFPYAIPKQTVPKKHHNLLFPVKGEVWKVTTEAVARSLDQLEGYPKHYDRVLIKTANEYNCWMYVQRDWSVLTYCTPCDFREGAWQW